MNREQETARLIRDVRPRLEASPAACGCAICPPRGARMPEREMERSLSALLDIGMPLALYQLPQVTENEMSPALVQRLAARYPHFVLFKDTSGGDGVARAELDLGGLFLVRGAEGGYAEHLKANGGSYNGLLLSSANYLGAALHAIVDLSEAGRGSEAEELSRRLTSLVEEVLGLVESIPEGNVFANSAKALDHHFAYGPDAEAAPAPRLHTGASLPRESLRAAGEALRRHGFLPERGYLA